MSQSRFVFLGFRSTYSSQYKVDVTYTDGTNLNIYHSTSFQQIPGTVIEIDDCVQITSVTMKDATSGLPIATFNAFTNECTGGCWPSSSMTGGSPFKITWEPSQRIVVVTDENLVEPKPHHKK
jgi:hypothetical protein